MIKRSAAHGSAERRRLHILAPNIANAFKVLGLREGKGMFDSFHSRGKRLLGVTGLCGLEKGNSFTGDYEQNER